MEPVTRREFLETGGAALVPAGAPRPNILFIMTDQHRFDCLGANGNRIIRTPNMDRLAAGSARFTNCFVQAPVCVPSRISFFTGRYPHSHRNRVNYTPCPSGEVFLHKLLKDGGYQTGSVGKLHFHPPTAEHARSTGLDRVFLDDGVPMADPFSDYVRWRNAHDPRRDVPYEAVAENIAPGKNPYRGAVAHEYTPTYWTGMQTLALLREFCASPKPFFLFSSFFKPHSPYVVPAPWDALYDDDEIPLPKQVSPGDIRRLPLPVQKQIKQTPGYQIGGDRLQWLYRSYYGAVSMIDREVGLMLDELEKSGQARNTIVIFTTDHGDQLCEHGLVGKNVFFEASVHLPLLIRFPKRVTPARHDDLVETVDLLPTILDLCGLPVPGNVQGRSLAGLLTGSPARPAGREVVFAENVLPCVFAPRSKQGTDRYWPYVPGQGVDGIRHPDAKMARTKRWKLNYYPDYGGELYDLENDPGEARNLYANPDLAKVVSDLKGAILDWMITADENDQIAPRWLL